MCNLYAKYVKIIEICKRISENLVLKKKGTEHIPMLHT